MASEELMGLVNRLLGNAQALAAVTARLRLDELGEPGDPAVRAQLDRVVAALGLEDELERLDERERSAALSFARSYLAQAVDLVEDPARAGAWTHSDPALLNAQGTASGVVARLIEEAGLGSPDGRILDVGTGVAGLAIALCATFPQATVVGLDPWEPALAIGRENVDDAGLGSRITLLPTPIESFEDSDGFDLIWLPAFFIPEALLEGAVARIFGVTRAGGTLVIGCRYGTDDDPVAAAVDDLFTVRSGGSLATVEELAGHLGRAGFEDVHEAERTWPVPLRLVVGRRP